MKSIEQEYCSAIRKNRNIFLQVIEPFRPELFRYCYSLTKQPWDAEDLVQETITRAYTKLSEVWISGIKDPKSYIFRIATHTWFDQCRRSGVVLNDNERILEELAPEKYDPLELKEALETMLLHLPPKQRVAILLKDVFDYRIQDISAIMETTAGAVKALLSRGRSKMKKLQNEHPSPTHEKEKPSEALLQELVKTFNSRDMDGMLSLFLEHASTEVVGSVQEWNRDEIREGSMAHTIYDGNGSPLPLGFPVAREVEVFGERLLILVEEGEILDDVLRIHEADGKVARWISYYYCPEVLRVVAEQLNMETKNHGYFPNMGDEEPMN